MGNTKFRITFADGESKTITAKYLKPEIVGGWWSYDKEGKEKYVYGEEKNRVKLGDTMYFHVQTRDIIAGNELSLQLIDYDYFWWMGEQIDCYDPDTKNFPNDPVILKAKVRGVTEKGEHFGKSIATVEILMDEKWEPVLSEDFHTIELYWQVRYTSKTNRTIKKNLPESKDDYLHVGYNNQDLFVKPAVAGSSLPEYYDKWGKLVLFTFKRANNVAKEINKNAAIERFIVTKIKIDETITLSGINKVKRQLYYERINLTTNDSKRMLFVTEEASEFYIKGKESFSKVTNTEIKKTKKFSEYFNKKDAGDIATVGLKEGREILRFLDYVSVTKTLMSMFPKEGAIGLEVPKPSSAASIIGTFATGELTWALGGALSSLFMVADIIATQEVNKIMNDVKDYNLELLQQAKLGGLSKLRLFLDLSRTEDLINFSIIDNVSDKTHCKVMNGEITTINDFRKSLSDDSSNSEVYYSYLIQKVTKKEQEREIFIVDSTYLQ